MRTEPSDSNPAAAQDGAALPGAVAPDGDTTRGTDPASAAAPPSRRTALLRSGLIVTVLVIVFVVILPRYIDYADVAAAFQDLTAQQFVLMTALGILAWAVSGLVFTALIEGLTVVRGMMSWLILAGIGASVPFGPWNMGVLWVVIRGWGTGIAPATSGVALYGVVHQLSRLVLPLLAIVALALSGDLSDSQKATTGWTIAIISAVIFVLMLALIVGTVRSERVAEWLGRTAQGAADWVLGHLGRTESPNVGGAIHRFRDQLGIVIRRRGLAALGFAILAQLVWVLVLVAGLRVVGIPESVLSLGVIFAVYGLVMVLTIIPLSPGGAGVPELLFISMFSAVAGPTYEAAITAGVFLYRIYYWFVPIPIAWILLKATRRGAPMLPTTSELKGYAKADPA